MLCGDAGLDAFLITWQTNAERIWDEILTQLNLRPEIFKTFLSVLEDRYPEDSPIRAIVERAGRWLDAKGVDGFSGDGTVSRKKSAGMRVVLVVASSPEGELPLALEEEYRVIRKMRESGTARDRFRLEFFTATTPADLQDGLLRYEPTILHISGHGPGTGILLQDATGDRDIIPKEDFIDYCKLAQGNGLELIMLNICRSIELGQELQEQGFYTIATKDRIDDRAAVDFSEGFYRALFHGKDYSTCFESGRLSVKQSHPNEARTFVFFGDTSS